MTAPVMRTRIHGVRRLKSVRVGFGSTIGGWHELRPRTHPEIVRAKSECLRESGEEVEKKGWIHDRGEGDPPFRESSRASELR